MVAPRVDIFICTFRRPHLEHTIQSLLAMAHPVGLDIGIRVIDNDDTESGLPYVRRFLNGAALPVEYLHAPGRNISIARNAALAASDADFIAFIDDDELADTAWLSGLWETLQSHEADIVFGQIEGVFPPETPTWMRRLDLHTPGPQRRNDKVETGISGTVLMRWQGTPWQTQRFDVARGRTGGEDTEFFFRLGQLGAKLEISETSLVIEPVDPARLNTKWLVRRRFRAGQSYAVTTRSLDRRVVLATKAAAKAVFSFLAAPLFFWSAHKWRFWFLRGVFHSGVVAGCLNMRQAEHYGHIS